MSQKSEAGGLRIRVVYPKPEQEIYEGSTFLLGSVSGASAGSCLKVNEELVPLSPRGFFAHVVRLEPGLNPIRLAVLAADSEQPLAIEAFALYRVPPKAVLPSLPLTVDEETLQPAGDVWLSQSDTLTVACLASEQSQVSLCVPDVLAAPVWLQSVQEPGIEGYLDTRQTVFARLHWTGSRIPVQGYYRATIPARMLSNFSQTAENLSWHLQIARDGETRPVPLPGTLTLLAWPRMARLREDAVTRMAPVDGARLTVQRAGTLLAVDGLQQGWLRVRLSRDEAFYVPRESVAFLPDVLAWVPAVLETLIVEAQGDDAASVRLQLRSEWLGAPPVRIETEALAEGLHRLKIRLYNTQSRCDFIRCPSGETIIRQVSWHSAGEHTVEVWVDLQRPLAGYDYEFQDGQWVLTVKNLPRSVSRTKILIDPGHGGPENGALGLDGAPEKVLNLAVSRYLQEALQAEGFQVSMTRTADEEVSLADRARQVQASQADLVLSIHHNALPDGRDPWQAQGTSTYYYHPFAHALAQTLLDGLIGAGGTDGCLPGYGLFYDSLAMTRIHQATAVLVEVGFLTHPDEYERLMEPEFQQAVARRLAAAIARYCQGKS